MRGLRSAQATEGSAGDGGNPVHRAMAFTLVRARCNALSKAMQRCAAAPQNAVRLLLLSIGCCRACSGRGHAIGRMTAITTVFAAAVQGCCHAVPKGIEARRGETRRSRRLTGQRESPAPVVIGGVRRKYFVRLDNRPRKNKC